MKDTSTLSGALHALKRRATEEKEPHPLATEMWELLLTDDKIEAFYVLERMMSGIPCERKEAISILCQIAGNDLLDKRVSILVYRSRTEAKSAVSYTLSELIFKGDLEQVKREVTTGLWKEVTEGMYTEYKEILIKYLTILETLKAIP